MYRLFITFGGGWWRVCLECSRRLDKWINNNNIIIITITIIIIKDNRVNGVEAPTWSDLAELQWLFHIVRFVFRWQQLTFHLRQFFPEVRALAYLLYKATVYRLLWNIASGCTQQRNDGMSSCPVVMPGGWPCTSNSLPMDSSQIVPQRGIIFSRFLMRPSVLQIFETSSGT